MANNDQYIKNKHTLKTKKKETIQITQTDPNIKTIVTYISFLYKTNEYKESKSKKVRKHACLPFAVFHLIFL